MALNSLLRVGDALERALGDEIRPERPFDSSAESLSLAHKNPISHEASGGGHSRGGQAPKEGLLWARRISWHHRVAIQCTFVTFQADIGTCFFIRAFCLGRFWVTSGCLYTGVQLILG